MYGITIAPPWGFGFGVWQGQAFNRFGQAIGHGSVGMLDVTLSQAETTTYELGSAAGAFANVRSMIANGLTHHPVVCLLEEAGLADNGYGRWSLANTPLRALVGTTAFGTTASATAGTKLYLTASKLFLDINPPVNEVPPASLDNFDYKKIVAMLLEDTPTFAADDTPVLLNVAFDGWAGIGGHIHFFEA